MKQEYSEGQVYRDSLSDIFLGETNLWWSSIVLTQAQYLTPCYLGYSQTSLKHPMRKKLATVTAHRELTVTIYFLMG